MCGIAGCFNGAEPQIITAMLGALRHRGPDEDGVYVAPDRQVCLGHRRLSIIDIAHGQEPMSNEDGSVWVTFNGEIYNHLKLRAELIRNGHTFKTNCDAEVLVHGWEAYGADLVEKLNGNYAFAIYDEKQRVCLLARDRLGIRPLFYTSVGDRLFFASEIKSLLKVPGVERRVDPLALDQYLSLRYSFGERTLLTGIYRLPPGHTMRLDRAGRSVQRYWQQRIEPQRWRLDEATERLDELLRESVRMRLMSDVPLGLYLSGGVDSALILALMARQMSTPVQTYSIGFGLDLDENDASRAIAQRFGANHTEIRLDRDSFRELPEIVRMMDEPLGDMIIIPTYALSKEAHKDVKVILTGEGADEVFGSYVHHYVMTWLDRYHRLCPAPLRSLSCSMLSVAPVAVLDRAFPYPDKLGKKGRERFVELLRNAEGEQGYLSLVQLFSPREKAALYSRDWLHTADDSWRSEFDTSGGNGVLLNRLIQIDSRNWLPDYTLFKQDRLSMANSIESRVPYLDHRLVELAGSLPVSFKQRRRTAKYLLRRVARRYLPAEVATRKKAAFYVPVMDFYGPEFQGFVRDSLAVSLVRDAGFLDPLAVQKLVDDGLRGGLLESKRLMAILILMLWWQAYVD